MEDELIEKVNLQLKFLISKQINRQVVKHLCFPLLQRHDNYIPYSAMVQGSLFKEGWKGENPSLREFDNGLKKLKDPIHGITHRKTLLSHALEDHYFSFISFQPWSSCHVDTHIFPCTVKIMT